MKPAPGTAVLQAWVESQAFQHSPTVKGYLALKGLWGICRVSIGMLQGSFGLRDCEALIPEARQRASHTGRSVRGGDSHFCLGEAGVRCSALSALNRCVYL